MKNSILFIVISIPFMVISSEQAPSSRVKKNKCGIITRLLYGNDFCQDLEDLYRFNEDMREVSGELNKANEDLKKINEDLKQINDECNKRHEEKIACLEHMIDLNKDINTNKAMPSDKK
jgi:hypothetical protein